ncbi:hypothetical protein [Pseudomonas chlororaphis]|uniref:hypothetical protein n=1 Tax=Pseudomonas chlororaphis TaxID=587753 RepID=UPI002407CCD4|nr:hypothetical protein [Pseudomonas chlororaphis]
MSEKLRLVSGGQKPPAGLPDKNLIEQKRRQLRKIGNTWQNQKIRSLGPRGIWAVLLGCSASLLVFLVSTLLQDFAGFSRGKDVVLVVAVAAFFAVRYVVLKRSTRPMTYAELLDTQLSAYDPVDVAAYRAFQNQVRIHGLKEDDVHYWLAQEYQALATLSGPIKRRKSFIDRKL